MRLLLLLIVTAACLCHIKAAVLRKYSYQDIVEAPLDEEPIDYFNSSDNYEATLAAAAEYFKAPEADKQQRQFAAALAYFKAPQSRQGFSEIEAARAAAAEYFKAPKIYRNAANDGTAYEDNLAAAVQYFRAPVGLQNLNGQELKANVAAAGEYSKVPGATIDSSKSGNEASRAAAAEYFRP
ncbi:PREDICTED: uncharacterized protein LOC108369179 [Rhagoletis zephyria]|uniref:uncharacterized protein LOC108369179 n=1 Tax=Rhagoletis zephyria TaxID=28612 RepID=UPI0008118429|nr:PREDICTED: uncharacterized protein LOC108369179 [Rhagoletis zephyria]